MNQQRFDESTLIRIFAIYELYRLKEHGLTRGALNDYHSRYKLVFLAHSQPEYRKLGPFVADIHQWQNLDDFYNQYYIQEFYDYPSGLVSPGFTSAR